jgi:hypothetical protein
VQNFIARASPLEGGGTFRGKPFALPFLWKTKRESATTKTVEVRGQGNMIELWGRCVFSFSPLICPFFPVVCHFQVPLSSRKLSCTRTEKDESIYHSSLPLMFVKYLCNNPPPPPLLSSIQDLYNILSPPTSKVNHDYSYLSQTKQPKQPSKKNCLPCTCDWPKKKSINRKSRLCQPAVTCEAC